MNGTSESDLIDHVQVCIYCRAGITFMASNIAWWRVAADKSVSDPIGQRAFCRQGPEGKHRPDLDEAVRLEKVRLSKINQQVGLPYDASLGTLS